MQMCKAKNALHIRTASAAAMDIPKKPKQQTGVYTKYLTLPYSTFVIPSVAEGTAVRLEGSSLLAGTQASALDGKASHTIRAEQAKTGFPPTSLPNNRAQPSFR